MKRTTGIVTMPGETVIAELHARSNTLVITDHGQIHSSTAVKTRVFDSVERAASQHLNATTIESIKEIVTALAAVNMDRMSAPSVDQLYEIHKRMLTEMIDTAHQLKNANSAILALASARDPPRG